MGVAIGAGGGAGQSFERAFEVPEVAEAHPMGDLGDGESGFGEQQALSVGNAQAGQHGGEAESPGLAEEVAEARSADAGLTGDLGEGEGFGEVLGHVGEGLLEGGVEVVEGGGVASQQGGDHLVWEEGCWLGGGDRVGSGWEVVHRVDVRG